MTTMKQIKFSEFGGSEVLKLEEVEIPMAGNAEVIIKTAAIGINFSDILRRRNTYFMPTPLPYVPGAEIAGTIVSCGDGMPPHLQVGMRVLAILPSGGGYAQYVKAHSQYCIPLPESISNESATALFVQGSSAQYMIDQVAGNIEGKLVLINGAAGGLGSILLQLAKLNGAKVIAGCGSDTKFSHNQKLGADYSINYTKDNWREIMEHEIGKPDVVFEMVGNEVYNESVKSLNDGGLIIIYGCASGIQGSIHPEYFVDHSLTQKGFNLAHTLNKDFQNWYNAQGDIIGLIAQQKVLIQHNFKYSFSEVALAHRMLEERRTEGKIVLIP